jgi:hypothetical protein
MTDAKQPRFYNLLGHGGEVVPDMLCCEGCGYGVCSCPAELPADEPYGCVNRQISSPRDCVESGHYWCQAFKSKPQPEPTLRAGWVIRGTFMGEPDYWFGDFNVCSSAGDGDWSICSECGFELAQRDTLEAAMLRAEELAGES